MEEGYGVEYEGKSRDETTIHQQCAGGVLYGGDVVQKS